MHKSYINSPTVHSAAYNHETKTLYIGYHHASTDKYADVPFIIYQRLITSYAPQKYIDRRIVNKYDSVKMS
ncbi:KTSC domain-containing protein [Providencia sp. Je.9.19]|uniref:KTSC domain-containing protein n=1 Tax=Providencia sp. Je.9.19 TaxID=3142844 RepID=UPI003DA7B149